MPNIIFTGDLNFPIIDWQMKTADGGTHENKVRANAFLQFAREQCLQQYIEEPKRKNNILDVFPTNNDHLKKSNLSYRDMNFFNEDISWASIDADMFNTSWDMLLTDVKTDEDYYQYLPGNL